MSQVLRCLLPSRAYRYLINTRTLAGVLSGPGLTRKPRPDDHVVEDDDEDDEIESSEHSEVYTEAFGDD